MLKASVAPHRPEKLGMSGHGWCRILMAIENYDKPLDCGVELVLDFQSQNCKGPAGLFLMPSLFKVFGVPMR